MAGTQNNNISFLKKGIHFNIDLLVIGFVTNDLPRKQKQKTLKWQTQGFFRILHGVLPNTLDFLSAYINTFLKQYVLTDYGYTSWENNLYTAENLKKYKNLLAEFAGFCQEKNINLIVALTPNTYHKTFREKFDKVIPLLEENQIAYIDLYPEVYEKLNAYSFQELRANPANGHPGNLVTQVYADKVFSELTRRDLLRQ